MGPESSICWSKQQAASSKQQAASSKQQAASSNRQHANIIGKLLFRHPQASANCLIFLKN
jgi:hypothetical protein